LHHPSSSCTPPPPHLHPFPTRRSSDLTPPARTRRCSTCSDSVTGGSARSRARTAGSRPRTAAAATTLRSRQPASSPTPSRCCIRSEEHTSELQSRGHLVCRLLLEKKKK